jgi:hypothetical protein
VLTLLWLCLTLLTATRLQWLRVVADERAHCDLCGERHDMQYRVDIHGQRPAWCCWHCTHLMTYRRSYAEQ